MTEPTGDRATELAEQAFPCNCSPYEDGSHLVGCHSEQAKKCAEAIHQREAELSRSQGMSNKPIKEEIRSLLEEHKEVKDYDLLGSELLRLDERTKLEALAAAGNLADQEGRVTGDFALGDMIRKLAVSGVSLEKFAEEKVNEVVALYSCPHMLRYPQCSECSPKLLTDEVKRLQEWLAATEDALKKESRRLQQELTDKFLQELDGPVPVFGGSQIERFRKKVAKIKQMERDFGYRLGKEMSELMHKWYRP